MFVYKDISFNLLFISNIRFFLPLSCEYGGLIEVDRFEEIFNIGEGDVTSLSKNISEFIENFRSFPTSSDWLGGPISLIIASDCPDGLC